MTNCVYKETICLSNDKHKKVVRYAHQKNKTTKSQWNNESRLAARGAHTAKADVDVRALGPEPDPDRRPQVPRVNEPGAPAQHAVRRGTGTSGIRGNKRVHSLFRAILIRGLLIAIFNPLPDIAVHIEETKRIRKLRTNRMRGTARVSRKPCIVLQFLLLITK